MPPSFLLFFPEGTWKTIYGYGRELAVDVGTLLLEQGHVFAVGRATSARDALQQHAGQLWEALERADFPSLKNMLGQTALLTGEALMFHAGAHLLEKMRLALTDHSALGGFAGAAATAAEDVGRG